MKQFIVKKIFLILTLLSFTQVFAPEDTRLIDAVLYHRNEVVQKLLKTPGINVNVQTEIAGYTPLIIAARDGRPEVVQELLKTPGIDVNLQDCYGNTALIWAARSGITEIVKNLLQAPGIVVNLKDHRDGYTALIHAAKSDIPEIVKDLLQAHGIEVNLQDHYGNTALIWAVVSGRTRVVRAFYENKYVKVDATVKNNEENTALVLAQRYGPPACVALLQRDDGGLLVE
jgi:ankyrin repeat protein